VAGAGGFINISQSAKQVVFVGTFNAGGLDVAVAHGRLEIRRQGRTRKFVEQVEHRTFSGSVALQRAHVPLYITERGVFRLTADGLELFEIAPGADLQRDILDQMAFAPRVASPLRTMDARLFADEPMGLRERMLRVPLAQRFTYDPAKGVFFANFEGLTVKTPDDVEALRAALEDRLHELPGKVPAIVDYDNFVVLPDVLDAYSDMVRDVAGRHYSHVTRYTTSAFLRSKLGEALQQRDVAPHIFESAEEARAHLDALAAAKDG